MKSYMGTAVKEMNIEAILAIMNTTELVDEIRPVWKKIQAHMDLNFFQALFQQLSSVHYCENCFLTSASIQDLFSDCLSIQ